MERVLVIGATGDQGHPLLRRLIEEGYTPVAALRNPDALKGTEFDSVETVQADLMDQSSMINAAKGMSYIRPIYLLPLNLRRHRYLATILPLPLRPIRSSGLFSIRVVMFMTQI